jgi:hypothetical protein
VVTLANNDILNFNDVLKKPLEECLLFLAYQSDYAHLQSILMKEANKQSNTF